LLRILSGFFTHSMIASGGKMILPVGMSGLQELMLIEKDQNGNIKEENLGAVTFVELKGDYGWNG